MPETEFGFPCRAWDCGADATKGYYCPRHDAEMQRMTTPPHARPCH